MERSEQVEAVDAWDRLTVVWHLLFGVTLALPTVLALLAPDPAGSRLLIAGTAAAFALWHWLVLARHLDWWERRMGVMAGYWVVACGLTTLLASLSGGFTLVMYGLFPLMFATLGWWGMVPIVALTALLGWARGGWDSGSVMLTNLLATAALAALVAFFVRAISQQSEERRDALRALAKTRAELAEASRRAGVMAERERLARDLHDTVAQGFASVVTQLESAEQAWSGQPDQARRHLELARHAARNGLSEVRRTVAELRPEVLETGTLAQALEEAVRVWSAGSGVPARMQTTGRPTDLSAETELALLRVTQEALANAAKHARCSRVVVTLSYLGDQVTLDVDDDGVGMSGATRPRPDGGFGLVGMRERVAELGGQLSIESGPGQGTTVAVAVPA